MAEGRNGPLKPEWLDGPFFCSLIIGSRTLAQVVRQNSRREAVAVYLPIALEGPYAGSAIPSADGKAHVGPLEEVKAVAEKYIEETVNLNG